MAHRKILIIHNRIMTVLLQKYIFSELNDISLMLTDDIDEAEELFHKESPDLVISGKEIFLSDKNRMYSILKNATTTPPFLIITTTETKENVQELQVLGITNYIVSPFTASALAEKINFLCDPRKWRNHDRLHIPQVMARIHCEPSSVEGKVVNLSSAGILVDLQYDGEINFFKPAKISIFFSENHKNLVIEDIKAKYFRSNVMSWGESNQPERIRVVWKFVNLSRETEQKLDKVIRNAGADLD